MNNTAEKLHPEQSEEGLKSVLRRAQRPDASPSKSKTPLISPSDEVRELAQDILEAKRAIDTAQTIFEEKTALLIAALADKRRELCRDGYVTSLRVPTLSGQSITISWTSRYAKIMPDREDSLIRLVGTRFKEYFKSVFRISADDKTPAELYELFGWLSPDGGVTEEGLKIGQERFAKFFAVDETIKPTERFTHDFVLMAPEMQQDLLEAGVKQYTPSIKTK